MSGEEDSKELESAPLLDHPELTGCSGSTFCHPQRAFHRYFMLVLMCFLGFGSYFCYDNPAALENEIESVMNVNTVQFETLYSLYSWPNVVLSVFGGFLIDRVTGLRWGAILFASIIAIGQVIFALGAQFNSFLGMEIGRFVFGLGGENLAVVQNAYAVSWFKGRELNMAFGLQLSFARLGSTVNMLSLENTYNAVNFKHDYQRLAFAFWTGALYCLWSLLCACVLAFFDKRRTRILKLPEHGTGEVVRVRDVKDFPVSLWLIFFICVTYYVSIFPFISLGTVFFTQKYQISSSSAHIVDSLVYTISLGGAFVFGVMVDKVGLNLFWVTVAILGTIVSHALMAFTWITPYAAQVIMGVSYSLLACALWPMVAMVVPEHQLGTAYGIMQAIQNLGLAVIALAAGKIVDDNGYLVLEVFFTIWLCAALFCAILLYMADAASGGKLNKTTWERRAEEKKAKNDFEESKSMDEKMTASSSQESGPPASADQLRNRLISRIGLPAGDNPAPATE